MNRTKLKLKVHELVRACGFAPPAGWIDRLTDVAMENAAPDELGALFATDFSDPRVRRVLKAWTAKMARIGHLPRWEK